MTAEPEPQVSWKAIERDAVVVAADGSEAAKVAEIVGDRSADIFDGLVLSVGLVDANRYLPAERVGAIWPRRVEVDATDAELKALPPYEEPVVERIIPEGGMLTRLRRLFGGR
ncbi:MAG TPA: hypothetical protein VMJ92_03755 [Candidatus Limnocylindrales bacterium]|nr:hypothetical protein [Candidatus Limnocylindrales bacterium]